MVSHFSLIFYKSFLLFFLFYFMKEFSVVPIIFIFPNRQLFQIHCFYFFCKTNCRLIRSFYLYICVLNALAAWPLTSDPSENTYYPSPPENRINFRFRKSFQVFLPSANCPNFLMDCLPWAANDIITNSPGVHLQLVIHIQIYVCMALII